MVTSEEGRDKIADAGVFPGQESRGGGHHEKVGEEEEEDEDDQRRYQHHPASRVVG